MKTVSTLIRKGISRRFREAFTLVELLVVIAIIGLLLTFVVPAATGIMSGFTLTQHGQDLMDKISLCRQLAMTQNREVELRIVEVPGGANQPKSYAYQVWMYDEKGANPLAQGRVNRIPDTIQVNEGLSPILGSLVSGRANFPALDGDRAYKALRYRVNGRVLGSFGTNNYLTLSYNRDSNESPKNFYTIQVNPVTGLITVFRP